MKTVAYVGSGGFSVFDERAYHGHLLQFFNTDDWEEIRVDLNPDVEPDVVADARDLPFEDASLDAVVCLACLEHLPEAHAGEALWEFHRVLCDNGQLIVAVPDLEIAARLIVEGKGLEVLYESDAGPVRALDMVYGHQRMAATNHFMAHQTGFTSQSLALWLWETGFDGKIDRTDADLWAYVTKVKPHQKERDAIGHLYCESAEPVTA